MRRKRLDPGLPAVRPSGVAVVRDGVGSAAGAVHGLVPALTSFVGRAAAVDEVAGLLGERRLVTVTGLLALT